MDNEFDILRFRLVIRGALDCFKQESLASNEALTAQGKVNLITTLESVETTLLWLRRMVETALGEEKR